MLLISDQSRAQSQRTPGRWSGRNAQEILAELTALPKSKYPSAAQELAARAAAIKEESDRRAGGRFRYGVLIPMAEQQPEQDFKVPAAVRSNDYVPTADQQAEPAAPVPATLLNNNYIPMLAQQQEEPAAPVPAALIVPGSVEDLTAKIVFEVQFQQLVIFEALQADPRTPLMTPVALKELADQTWCSEITIINLSHCGEMGNIANAVVRYNNLLLPTVLQQMYQMFYRSQEYVDRLHAERKELVLNDTQQEERKREMKRLVLVEQFKVLRELSLKWMKMKDDVGKYDGLTVDPTDLQLYL